MTLPTLAIVGTGAVARAIARRHVDAGGSVVAVRSRDLDRAAAFAARVAARPAAADADLAGAAVVVVAVPDRAISAVGARLAGAVGDRAVVLHTSGALSAAALGDGLPRAGSLHPLQSLPPAPEDAESDARLAARLMSCHWFHEGAGEEIARALVAAWQGTLHALAPGAKVLYHAAAATVSNHTVALFDAAIQVLAAAGIDREDARAPLASLLAGTTANLSEVGALEALTGPVARGDVETVAGHVDALRRATPHLVASYVEAALLAVDVAVRRGSLDVTTAERLRGVLHR
jgi:predicted short-subunit dehydrogenase-like oxidoreductase (DUF2520 family)